MKTRLTALCAWIALCVVPAGCGGDDDGEEDSSNAATKPSEEPADRAAGGGRTGTVKVLMKDIAFLPRSVTVRKGGTVTWLNGDRLEHDVAKRSGPGRNFTSGEPGGLAPGDTYENAFRTPGNIAYYCRVHPRMRGTIAVRRRARGS
jgi:plastocyanin